MSSLIVFVYRLTYGGFDWEMGVDCYKSANSVHHFQTPEQRFVSISRLIKRHRRFSQNLIGRK
jgi:hypothetical protein